MTKLQNNQEVIHICGKHKFKTKSAHAYHLHIINDHDDEHGLWQAVGETRWTKNGKPWYGYFRYLPIYKEKPCWQKFHQLASRRFGNE